MFKIGKIIPELVLIFFLMIGVGTVYAGDFAPDVQYPLADGTEITISARDVYNDPDERPGYYKAEVRYPNGEGGTFPVQVWVKLDPNSEGDGSGNNNHPRCYGAWTDIPGTMVCPSTCGVVTCSIEQEDGCGKTRKVEGSVVTCYEEWSGTEITCGSSRPQDVKKHFNSCQALISDWGACDANHQRTRSCTDLDGMADLDGDGFATGSGEDINDDCSWFSLSSECTGVIQGTLFDASDMTSCNLGSVGNAASLGVVATGGTITRDGQYTIHTFIASGSSTFSVSQAGLAEVLVVAGGGGGGAKNTFGSGGGAGGVVHRSNQTIPKGDFSVVVGSGGYGGLQGTANRGTVGGNSVFMDMLARGGGAGGGGAASNGGSGGGGGSAIQEDSGGGTGYGHNGGANDWLQGGGGGGAGEAGSDVIYMRAGDPEAGSEGGDGFFSNISGTNKAYGGGGGGVRYRNSTYANLSAGAPGGVGGGGTGGTGNSYASSTGIAPTAGAPNTGGGGGGCYLTCDATGRGARGGSGVVIIRYLTRPLNQLLPSAILLPEMNNFPIGIGGTWPLINPPVTLDENGNYYEPVYASAVTPTYTFDYTELLNSDKVAGIKLQCQGTDATVTQNNQVVTKDIGFWRVYGGWWQVTGGNVYGKNGVHSDVPASMVPASNQKLILTNADGVSGFLSYGTPWVGLELGTNPDVAVSDPLWRIESAYEGLRYDYNFYNTKMDVFTATTWDGGSVDYNDGGVGYQIFKHNGNVTLDYAGPTGTQKAILMVNGNVTINNDIVVPSGAYLAIIAKGNITFSPSVANAQGWFVAENINVPCVDTVAPAGECDRTDIQFSGEGSFVGWSGINMTRDRFKTNNQEPSEKFAYRADMLLNVPTPMKVYTKRFSPFVP